MATTPLYDLIKKELECGELKQRAADILRALLDKVGQQGNEAFLTRADLVRVTEGREAWQNIGDDPADRKNRLAINALRDRLIPVMASSGQAGYRLELSVEGLDEMRAEMVARRDRAAENIAKIDEMIDRCNSTPIPTPVHFRVAVDQSAPQPIQMAFV